MVENRDIAIEKIKNSLQTVERRAAGLRRTHTSLLMTSMFGSAITTLIAGITAAAGPVVGTGIPGWRLACSLAAIFGFVTTVAAGMNQQLRLGDQLSTANQLLGRLRFLDVAAAMGTRSWEEITTEYAEIVKGAPEIL
jgi:hypothetical protein